MNGRGQQPFNGYQQGGGGGRAQPFNGFHNGNGSGQAPGQNIAQPFNGFHNGSGQAPMQNFGASQLAGGFNAGYQDNMPFQRQQPPPPQQHPQQSYGTSLGPRQFQPQNRQQDAFGGGQQGMMTQGQRFNQNQRGGRGRGGQRGGGGTGGGDRSSTLSDSFSRGRGKAPGRRRPPFCVDDGRAFWPPMKFAETGGLRRVRLFYRKKRYVGRPLERVTEYTDKMEWLPPLGYGRVGSGCTVSLGHGFYFKHVMKERNNTCIQQFRQATQHRRLTPDELSKALNSEWWKHAYTSHTGIIEFEDPQGLMQLCEPGKEVEPRLNMFIEPKPHVVTKRVQVVKKIKRPRSSTAATGAPSVADGDEQQSQLADEIPVDFDQDTFQQPDYAYQQQDYPYAEAVQQDYACQQDYAYPYAEAVQQMESVETLTGAMPMEQLQGLTSDFENWELGQQQQASQQSQAEFQPEDGSQFGSSLHLALGSLSNLGTAINRNLQQ